MIGDRRTPEAKRLDARQRAHSAHLNAVGSMLCDASFGDNLASLRQRHEKSLKVFQHHRFDWWMHRVLAEIDREVKRKAKRKHVGVCIYRPRTNCRPQWRLIARLHLQPS